MTPKYSIVTTCMGRLDHLKESLPAMLAQPDSEVIVVDYSCPQGTGDYVAKHFPAARVVRVEGRENLKGLRGPVLFASNHQSYFDTPVINGFGDLVGFGTKRLGVSSKVIQTGKVQQYLLVGMIVVVVMALGVTFLAPGLGR